MWDYRRKSIKLRFTEKIIKSNKVEASNVK